jgi:hypothetical protein
MEPVANKLNLIITHLEAERKSLKRMIKEASSEGDNLIVYYHQEALAKLESHLDVFYSFRDPDYHKKNSLKRYILYLKKYKESKIGKNFRDYLKQSTQNRINKTMTELQNLIDNPTTKSYSQTSHLDHALLELFEKKIKSFKLVINEEVGFVLVFKMKKKILFIEFDIKIEFYEQDFILNERIPNPLKGFSFELNQERKKYIRTLNFDSTNEIPQIKIWLSHFLIDFCGIYFSSEGVKLVYK